jgi:transketolase
MPNISLWRPADAVETAVAWQMAIERRDGPTILALTRQSVLGQPRTALQVEQIKQGGYVIFDSQRAAEIILLATGSEVALAMQAAAIATEQGRAIRVVSMPSVDVFLAQPKQYQETVLPPTIPKIAIEAGVTVYWQQFVQGNGKIIGIDDYGASAPGQEVSQYFGLTVARVLEVINEI